MCSEKKKQASLLSLLAHQFKSDISCPKASVVSAAALRQTMCVRKPTMTWNDHGVNCYVTRQIISLFNIYHNSGMHVKGSLPVQSALQCMGGNAHNYCGTEARLLHVRKQFPMKKQGRKNQRPLFDDSVICLSTLHLT